jgi:hypothetical protein
MHVGQPLIIASDSDLDAKRDRDRLLEMTLLLLENNKDLARRLACLEGPGYDSESVITARRDSSSFAAATTMPSQDLSIDDTPKTLARLSLSHFRNQAHEHELQASRVYRKAQRGSDGSTFHSSLARSNAWSALSDISLSEISSVSVIALPLYPIDIKNRGHYWVDGLVGVQRNHLHPAQNDSPQWPLTYTALDYLQEGSLLELAIGSMGSQQNVHHPVHLKLMIEGAKEVDVHGLLEMVNPHRRSPYSNKRPNTTQAARLQSTQNTSEPESLLPGSYATIVRSYTKSCKVFDGVVDLDIQAVGSRIAQVELNEDYFKNGDMYMFMYDTSLRSTFAHTMQHPRLIYRHKNRNKNTYTVPIMIVGKRPASNRSRMVTFKEVDEFAKRNGCLFSEVDESDDQAVNELFFQMVKWKWECDRVKEVDLSTKILWRRKLEL